MPVRSSDGGVAWVYKVPLGCGLCRCVRVPVDIVVLPDKLCVTLVELVHDEGHLW